MHAPRPSFPLPSFFRNPSSVSSRSPSSRFFPGRRRRITAGLASAACQFCQPVPCRYYTLLCTTLPSVHPRRHQVLCCTTRVYTAQAVPGPFWRPARSIGWSSWRANITSQEVSGKPGKPLGSLIMTEERAWASLGSRESRKVTLTITARLLAEELF